MALSARSWLCVLALLGGLAGLTPSAGAANKDAPKLDTRAQKLAYALGIRLGTNLPLGLSPDELAALAQGMVDRALEHEPRIDLKPLEPELQEFTRVRASRAYDREIEASKAFLEQAATGDGVEKKASGLLVQVLEEGKGPSPGPKSRVRVHYTGVLRNGQVFDSSVQRGQPAEFGLDQVVPCWREGLQTMKVGGKSRLYCPSSIAYGRRGYPPMIHPGAALVFEVELLEILD